MACNRFPLTLTLNHVAIFQSAAAKTFPEDIILVNGQQIENKIAYYLLLIDYFHFFDIESSHLHSIFNVDTKGWRVKIFTT